MFYLPNPSCDVVDSSDDGNTARGEKSSLLDCETELNTLDKDLNLLRSYALSGKLKNSRLRSVYWRVLLGVLPPSSSEWSELIQDMRCKYHALKNNFTLDPHRSPCLPNDNPLSQDKNSVWYRYFCDVELKRVIRQDVIRTSPDKQFFQSPRVQEIMIDVLFIYARENPDMCYRQGMHEILALLLYVIHEDCQRMATEQTKLAEVLDAKYLEHDLYHLFSAIMKRLGQFYESDFSNMPNACGHFPSSLPNDSRYLNNIPFSFETMEESGISLHLNSVIRRHLSANDPALYQHLKKLNIPYTVFGIRWLRLLFGREFPLVDLFALWDAIFAVDCEFVLVNHILVAMLIAIRNELLHHDYVRSLNHLMNYPKTVDISHIIRLALYLKDPAANKKPKTAPGIVKNGSGVVALDADFFPPATFNPQNASKSSTINSKKTKNMKWNIVKKVSSAVYAEPKNSDSSSSKDHEKILAELKHVKVVMLLCKMKLSQYHHTLSASIEDDDIKAQHALTGIQELCTLLDIDHFPMPSTPLDDGFTDAAREMKDALEPLPANGESSPHATDDAVAMCLPPPKTDIDMTTFMFIERSLKDPSSFPPECPHKAAPTSVTNEED